MVDTLIHMTAEYSNAVLVAVMPHVSAFAAKMDLPIPQPITVNHIAKAAVVPRTWTIAAGVWFTNGYWFQFNSHGTNLNHGFVSAYSAPTNWFHKEGDWPDEALAVFFGTSHMTANEAVALARAALLKAGYAPSITRADQPPTRIEGPNDMKRLKAHVPYCQVEWSWPSEQEEPRLLIQNHNLMKVQINTETRSVVGMVTVFGANNPPPLVYVKPRVEPELESDFRKRQQMFTDTNAPPHRD